MSNQRLFGHKNRSLVNATIGLIGNGQCNVNNCPYYEMQLTTNYKIALRNCWWRALQIEFRSVHSHLTSFLSGGGA
jgi:hypothetical protein